MLKQAIATIQNQYQTWQRQRRIDRAIRFMGENYAETFDLLAKYDKGEVPGPEKMADPRDVQEFARRVRQTLRPN